ncbi:hypothetical protein AG1IA_07134 [Rhizoctonia solani AG-1 IA]|uniref:Uncharacterized protein n=1 Tax=Thanatephorus cucumeris (strain AG1-IA) TaxID=983506 RepID=L8WKZ4_THACA|nr:hypothetical protein AG1IA_07134 [Rhizoctonia solani AG-1 IA]
MIREGQVNKDSRQDKNPVHVLFFSGSAENEVRMTWISEEGVGEGEEKRAAGMLCGILSRRLSKVVWVGGDGDGEFW